MVRTNVMARELKEVDYEPVTPDMFFLEGNEPTNLLEETIEFAMSRYEKHTGDKNPPVYVFGGIVREIQAGNNNSRKDLDIGIVPSFDVDSYNVTHLLTKEVTDYFGLPIDVFVHSIGEEAESESIQIDF